MATQAHVTMAENLLLTNGSLTEFAACFKDDSDTVINGLYQRALNNPTLKDKIIDLGVWDSWQQSIN